MDPGSSATGLHVDVWPTRSGSLHFPRLDGRTPTEGRDAILTAVAPQSAVVLDDATVRDELVTRGARQVRHLYTMRHELDGVPAESQVAGVELRPWHEGDAALLAPALLTAYDAEHPDARAPDVGQAEQSLVEATEDSDNPLMSSATQVALVHGRPVGAALVLRSEHVPPWCGPWLMNIFRAPNRTLPGVGAAMLTRALAVLKEADEQHVGLAVTSTNPARHLYEGLGFVRVNEYWIVVLPEPT